MKGIIEPVKTTPAPSRIYLTGFMASGKSTVGLALAEALHKNFFDLDLEIESRLGKSIAQIFKDEGAAFFREVEREVLIELSQLPNAVIALGGGTLLDYENLELVQQSGISICLTATPEEIWKRIEHTDKSHLITGPAGSGSERLTTNQIYDRISLLMSIRKPGYEQSQLTIDSTGKTIPQIVQEILILLEPYQFLR